MKIGVLLSGGKPPKQLAKLFVNNLLQRSQEDEARFSELCAEFAESILKFVGFDCKITSEHVLTGNYVWPNSVHIYVFLYNPLAFQPMAAFLTDIASAIANHEQLVTPKEWDERCMSPVGCFLKLLNVWCNIFTNLLEQEINITAKRFEEPMARINFCLLLGLHPLRKTYNLNYIQLDAMCDCLYRSAVVGVFYPECHTEFVEGFFTLFSDDFNLFYKYSPDSLNFLFDAFSVENRKTTHIKVYEFLSKMIEFRAQDELLILTNYLIKNEMQEVYFTHLKFGKTKRLLIAVLTFLKILQSKLPTLDCFSKPFIETLFGPILKQDSSISSLAANVYIIMMQRKFNDDIIFKHILEGYFIRMSSTDMLSDYIKKLGPVFPALYDFEKYIQIIKSTGTTNLYRSYAAQFLVFISKEMLQDFVMNCEKLEHLLLMLPRLLNELTCQIVLGCLLQIYAVINFNYIRNYMTKYIEIFQLFENYAVETFMFAAYDYPLLSTIFWLLNSCLKMTTNWNKLETISLTVCNQFLKIDLELDKESIKVSSLAEYNKCLQKLNLLLKTEYDIVDSLEDFFVRIKERLITKPQIYEFVAKSNSFNDVYAIEILTSCLKKLAKQTFLSERQKLFISTKAQELVDHLLIFLRNVNNLANQPLVRVRAIFCSFIDLHCVFNGNSAVCEMRLTTESYFLLVEALLLINFDLKNLSNEGDEELQLHSLRNFEYQKDLFSMFNKLHDDDDIALPANVVWKLCINYGLPSHEFNTFIAELLKIIANKHITIYKHILPVMIYNLAKLHSKFSDYAILKAIKAHKDMINNILDLENPSALKVHIVLTVLQIIEKSVKVLPLNTAANRLGALKHLHVLIEDIKWTDNNILEMIIKQANEIKSIGLLTPDEAKTYKKFLIHFEMMSKQFKT